MLQNFNPSFVLDLTATPKRGSNIISFVDARQLKSGKHGKVTRNCIQQKITGRCFISAVSLKERKLELEAVQGQKTVVNIFLLYCFRQPKNNADSTTYEKISIL